MEVLVKDFPVVVDNIRYLCTLELVTVKGGQNVLYVAENGAVLKQEPYHRYKERIARKERRKTFEN